MTEEETQRGTPKRQIARLIGNSSIPIYVLGVDDRIVFANDALTQLLGVDSESLIGIDCSRNVPADGSQPSILAALLALPPNLDRSLMDLHSIELPNVPVPLIRVVFPIEDSSYPTVFCAIKQEHGDLESLRGAAHRTEMQQFLARSGIYSSAAAELWFLCGTSPSILRTRQQIETAMGSATQASVHVIGPAAPSTLAVAKRVAARRTTPSPTGSFSTGPFIVECELMDRTLLLSTFEMIDDLLREPGRNIGAAGIILHQVDKLPGALVEPLCSWHSTTKRSLIATSAATDLLELHPHHTAWGQFAASLDAHVVLVPSLAQRLTDIEALVAVWLETALKKDLAETKYRWTREFIDPMLAYSWPGDVQEFDETMREAIRKCPSLVLTEQELPISIRTFPSHMRRPAPLPKLDLDSALEQFERQLILQAMSHFPRNRTAAATFLGMSRTRFLRRLQQLGLEPSGPSGKQSESDEPMFEEWDDEGQQ